MLLAADSIVHLCVYGSRKSAFHITERLGFDQCRHQGGAVRADGTTFTPGAEIRGHVDKIEAAHKAGRARMWLTFDDIKTPDGWIPLVATVTDIPGVHSIRVDYNREGEIEASSSKRQEALEAAAAGAFVGAAPGVASHNDKDAALRAATAAAAAYMVTSGLGQELTLEKDIKLEAMLDRSLYFGRSASRY